MMGLNKHAKLALKIQQDLIKRSRQGIWAHPICLLLVFVTTGLGQREPLSSWAFVGCVLMQAVLRWAVLHTTSGDAGRTEQRWRSVHLCLLLSCAAVWGIAPGLALWKFGYQDKDVLVLLLYQSAIAFGTVNVLVHNQRLIALAMVFLFAPPIAGSLLHGGASYKYLGAAFAYVLYCIVQGKKLNEVYLSQISDNFDLSVVAYQDCLTGLPNRLYMNEALEKCFNAKDRRMKIALLYIDLDGFKLINDRHSHKIGDLFLCEAASRIRRSLRTSDIAARIGGDEFTVLLPECTSENEALRLAERILCDARLPIYISGHELTYSASIGVSVLPHTAQDPDMLVRTADEAMYVAKSSGKNRVCMALSGEEKTYLNDGSVAQKWALLQQSGPDRGARDVALRRTSSRLEVQRFTEDVLIQEKP